MVAPASASPRPKTRRIQAFRLIVAALLLAVGLQTHQRVVYAGNGTPADPWQTINIFYNWANNNRINNTHQVINPSIVQPGSLTFWAYAGTFTATSQGAWYIGVQTNGFLKGNRNGEQVGKSAHFSLFGNGVATSYRRVTTDRCSPGADGGSGIACAVQYNWTTALNRRVTIFFSYNVNNSAWCPASSQNSCTVANGNVSLNSNPGAYTQIGVWTIRQASYGETAGTNSFLEVPPGFGNCNANNNPQGIFTLPFKDTGTLLSATSFDRTDTQYPQTCGRVYNEGLTTVMYYAG